MDDLSFFGTIISVISIQLSFYWLFRDDFYTQQLTKSHIEERKLAVLLINSGDFMAKELKCKLEKVGFIIYEINFSQDSRISFNHGTIRLNLAIAEHTNQAIQYIHTQFKIKNLNLHAYISLPTRLEPKKGCESTRSVEGFNLIQDLLMPSLGFLISFSSSMLDDRTRIIRIRNELSLNLAGPCKLVSAFEKGVSEFLSSCHHHLVELEVKSEKMDDQVWNGYFSNFINYASNRLRFSHFFEILGRYVKLMCVANGKSERITKDEASDSLNLNRVRLEEKIIQLICIRTLQVNPRSRTIVY